MQESLKLIKNNSGEILIALSEEFLHKSSTAVPTRATGRPKLFLQLESNTRKKIMAETVVPPNSQPVETQQEPQTEVVARGLKEPCKLTFGLRSDQCARHIPN